MRALYLIALMYLIGCAGDSSLQTIDVDKEEQAIRARWDAFIENWEQKNATACADLYTERASHIAPNSDINAGRAAIAAFYETLFLDHAASQYTHTIERLDIGQDMAIEQGNFTVIWTRGDSSQWSFNARSLTHWVRQDGQWMIEQLMFNLPKG